jgi:hypothetical protein
MDGDEVNPQILASLNMFCEVYFDREGVHLLSSRYWLLTVKYSYPTDCVV